MDVQNQNRQSVEVSATRRNSFIGGLALIAVGLFLTIVQFVESDALGMLVLPGLAVIFLVWGSVTRKTGLIIPGGILGGIGLGAWLIDGPLANLEGGPEGGVFLLAFAAGWASITLFAALFAGEQVRWPLIPAAIMGVIGVILVVGEAAAQALTFAGRLWPLALVAAGLYLIIRRNK
ncbi:MAG: hypothetical protein ACE5G8_00755 [Anaerolineae bacterium]